MKTNLIALLFVGLPLLSLAHGYWLEVKGDGQVGQAVAVQLYFGEYENSLRERGEMLASMSDFKAYAIDPSGKRIEIPLRQTETCWEAFIHPIATGHLPGAGRQRHAGRARLDAARPGCGAAR